VHAGQEGTALTGQKMIAFVPVQTGMLTYIYANPHTAKGKKP